MLNRLRELLPEIRVTVQCELDTAVLAHRLAGPFTHVAEATDLGMLMFNPTRVRVADSIAAYLDFHADWEQQLERQIKLLREHQPDLVFANVPYLLLPAARHLGVRSFAMCSLNWADLLEHYADGDSKTAAVVETIRSAYDCAELFLQPEPSMTMPALANRRAVGPVARLGRARRAELCHALGIGQHETLVLVTLGGVDGRLAMERWQSEPGVHWLTPLAWNVDRPDCHPLEETAFGFLDALASCDALLTKPGYGSFAEAACAGVPVLYVSRIDWPEEPYLVRWMSEKGRLLELSPEDLRQGRVVQALSALLALPAKPAVTPSGVDEVADLLRRNLTG